MVHNTIYNQIPNSISSYSTYGSLDNNGNSVRLYRPIWPRTCRRFTLSMYALFERCTMVDNAIIMFLLYPTGRATLQVDVSVLNEDTN